jgi:hypothetical protein
MYAYIYEIAYVYDNSIMRPTKNCPKGGWREEEEERIIERVNLIKAHYMPACKHHNETPLHD